MLTCSLKKEEPNIIWSFTHRLSLLTQKLFHLFLEKIIHHTNTESTYNAKLIGIFLAFLRSSGSDTLCGSVPGSDASTLSADAAHSFALTGYLHQTEVHSANQEPFGETR